MNDLQIDCYAELKNNTYKFTHPELDPPVTRNEVRDMINSPKYLRDHIKSVRTSDDD